MPSFVSHFLRKQPTIFLGENAKTILFDICLTILKACMYRHRCLQVLFQEDNLSLTGVTKYLDLLPNY